MINLGKDDVIEYIKDTINSCKMGTYAVSDARYHYSAIYSKAVSICRYGLLPLIELKNKKINNYSEAFLNKMSDIESHANGIDGISLCVMGLDDLYPNEDEYYPDSPYKVDFLVSNDVKVSRYSVNYGNEFISYSSIGNEKIRAIDIRLLELIDILNKNKASKQLLLEDIVKNYNYLPDIALTIRELNLGAPLRESSYKDSFSLDIDKLAATPKIKLI